METCAISILKSRSTSAFFDCPSFDLKMRELKTLLQNIKRSLRNENPEFVDQAVLFEFRQRTMLNPFSLIGSRIFFFLAELWNMEEEIKCQ